MEPIDRIYGLLTSSGWKASGGASDGPSGQVVFTKGPRALTFDFTATVFSVRVGAETIERPKTPAGFAEVESWLAEQILIWTQSPFP